MIEFNQIKSREYSYEGEATRLYNEIKGGIEYGIDDDGNKIISPIGYDVLTISLEDLKLKIGKSQAQQDFISTIIKIREGEITTKQIELLGRCGYKTVGR